MKAILLGCACFFLLAMPCLADNVDEHALTAAGSFAALIDDNNFQAAYWSGSPLLQRANVEQQWIDLTERSKLVLGKVLTRSLKRIRAATSPPFLPDDDYRIILFEAQTEYKAKAAEIILAHQVDGSWKVCSYSIR